jgi:hypothetical protein
VYIGVVLEPRFWKAATAAIVIKPATRAYSIAFVAQQTMELEHIGSLPVRREFAPKWLTKCDWAA